MWNIKEASQGSVHSLFRLLAEMPDSSCQPKCRTHKDTVVSPGLWLDMEDSKSSNPNAPSTLSTLGQISQSDLGVFLIAANKS